MHALQNTIVGGIEPTSYSLSLTSIDGIGEPRNNIATSFMRDVDSTTLNVGQPLPRRRLWSYQVLALGCIENPVTNSFLLSKSS